MFTKLDADVLDRLRCPLCKSDLRSVGDGLRCPSCATAYERRSVQHRDHVEEVLDMRVHRPPFAVPGGMREWLGTQDTFEGWTESVGAADAYDGYLDEIDTLVEIYADEFEVTGDILDVGGHQGRLRVYLDPARIGTYVSVDPYIDVFRGVEDQPGLLRAYPVLTQPCNFLACHAEALPFASASFDTVHMRSVLDHFYDPYIALKEAHRVLRPGGTLLVGLTLTDPGPPAPPRPVRAKIADAIRREGLAGPLRAAVRRSRAGAMHRRAHMKEWSGSELSDLLAASGFRVTKEHRQKPPFGATVYLSATATEGR